MPIGEATNTKFIVFGFARPELAPSIYRTRGEHANHYATDAVEMAKGKRINNDLQNSTHKAKDRVTLTPLKTGGELMCSGRVSSSCSTSGTSRVNFILSKAVFFLFFR